MLSVVQCVAVMVSLTLLLSEADAMEVYLRELTVFTSHENSFFSNSPEVYFVCEDSREPVLLHGVVEVNKKYKFEPEQIPATHIDEGKCMMCTLKEFDLLDADDVYGEMKLCADSFTKTGFSVVHSDGEFHARFGCPLCKVKNDEKIRVHTHGSAESHVQSRAVSNSAATTSSGGGGTSKKSMSAGWIVFVSLVMFAIGVAVGVAALKYLTMHERQREAQRVRDLNSFFSQPDAPYDAIPRGTENKKRGMLKAGVATYELVPSDETGDTP